MHPPRLAFHHNVGKGHLQAVPDALEQMAYDIDCNSNATNHHGLRNAEQRATGEIPASERNHTSQNLQQRK
jgi:hypothetical protein